MFGRTLPLVHLLRPQRLEACLLAVLDLEAGFVTKNLKRVANMCSDMGVVENSPQKI